MSTCAHTQLFTLPCHSALPLASAGCCPAPRVRSRSPGSVALPAGLRSHPGTDQRSFTYAAHRLPRSPSPASHGHVAGAPGVPPRTGVNETQGDGRSLTPRERKQNSQGLKWSHAVRFLTCSTLQHTFPEHTGARHCVRPRGHNGDDPRHGSHPQGASIPAKQKTKDRASLFIGPGSVFVSFFSYF